MKANRKFRSDDDAVSPVIAVILMVAITVVLAATVYVWVSGFGSQSSQPAKSIALSSAGALSGTAKHYTIASGTPGMKWSDLSITIDGAALNQTLATTNGVSGGPCPANAEASTVFLACGGGNTEATSAVINAGDTLKLYGVSAGQTLRILDSQANSVMLTLTIG